MKNEIKGFLKRNIYFSTAKNLNYIFDKELKNKSISITFFVLISVFIDLVGLSLIFPVIMIALDVDVLLSNKYILFAYNYFEFSSIKKFLVFFVSTIFLFFFLKICYLFISKRNKLILVYLFARDLH